MASAGKKERRVFIIIENLIKFVMFKNKCQMGTSSQLFSSNVVHLWINQEHLQNQKDAEHNSASFGGPMSSPSFIWTPFPPLPNEGF